METDAKNTVVHELMHVLAVPHAHQHQDRVNVLDKGEVKKAFGQDDPTFAESQILEVVPVLTVTKLSLNSLRTHIFMYPQQQPNLSHNLPRSSSCSRLMNTAFFNIAHLRFGSVGWPLVC